MCISKSGKVKKRVSFFVKLVALIMCSITVVMVFWVTTLVRGMQQSTINDRESNEISHMERIDTAVTKTVEVCNFTLEIVANSNNLMSYFQNVQNGQDLPIQEKLSFYKDDISILYKMANTNPYLYQVRVYVNSDQISEKMPSVYNKERMRRLSWAQQEYGSGRWYLDYQDTLFSAQIMSNTEHIAGYIKVISNDDGDELCVIEIATEMECFFPELYSDLPNEWSCYVDAAGKIHGYEGQNNKWSLHGKDILQKVEEQKENTMFHTVIADENVIISSMPVKGLGGTYIHLTSMESSFHDFYQKLFLYLFYITGAFIILFFVIEKIVKLVMKRFYRLSDAVGEVQDGNLEVVVPELGNDEITDLSRQFNEMVTKIKQLMEDNLNRQLLAKNSEIKSLQNQINAHFIYNVLESIKMMAEVEEQYSISDSVTSLGKLLRYSMKWNSSEVTVADEIDYIRNYLLLMNLRFDYEIYLSLNISENIYQQKIPKMSLQPVVENAIYHGIEQMAEDTNIYIKGYTDTEKPDVCVLEISDAGNGMTEEKLQEIRNKLKQDVETSGGQDGHGIGLKNVQDRIRMSFGAEYGLEVYSKLSCYTKVIMRIPYTHMEGDEV